MFQSLIFFEKNEYLSMFILDRGNVFLDLMGGWILPGNGILTYTSSEAIIIEYVSYGPVLDHFDFDYVFFLPRVPYRGRIFN